MLKAINPIPEVTLSENTAASMVSQYLHQLRSITIIRLLQPLFISSQQHRGANLALFEGNDQFRNKVSMLQNEINNRLQTLEMINKEFAETLPGTELMQLKQEWGAVRDWQGGSALENFKLQSHFIEQQMKLIWLVTENANCFASISPASDPDASPREQMYAEALSGDNLLIQFVLRELPELIELLAKLRGLATHVSVLAYCDEEHYSWLEYLLKLLNQKKEKFRELSRHLHPYVFGDVPAIIDLQIQDTKIVHFVQVVERNILSHNNITVESQEIFNMASEIIDAHSVVVTQGLGFVRNKINKLLDDWHVEHQAQ